MIPIHRARPTKHRLAMLLGILALASLAAACRDQSGALNVDEIVDRVVKAQSEVTSVHQVADISIDVDENSVPVDDAMGRVTSTIETWTDGRKMRLEWQGDDETMGGTVMVSDGQTMQMYMASTGQVMEMPVPTLDEAASSPEQSIAMTREWVTHLLQRADVAQLGIEEVAGRKAIRLEAKPKAGADGSDAADRQGGTVWVDSERFYPLKYDMAIGPMRMVMTVREIEYNATIPPERFTLDVPDDAEKVDVPMPSIDRTSPEEAAAMVGFPLLAADAATSGFQLQDTQVMDMPGRGEDLDGIVMQTYKGPAGTIMVQQMPVVPDMPDMAAMMAGAGESSEVEVGGHAATLISLGLAGSMLSWQADGTSVTVSGDVSEEDLLAFAATLR